MTCRLLPITSRAKGDVLEDRLVRQELEVLEHASDIAAQVRHTPVAHGRQVLVRDVDVAFRRRDLVNQHTDERGLAGSRMADEEDELARVNLQGDVGKCRLVRLRRIDLRDVVEGDDGRRRLLRCVRDIEHGKRLGELLGCLSLTAVRPRPRTRARRARLGSGTQGVPAAGNICHSLLRSNSDVLRQSNSSSNASRAPPSQFTLAQKPQGRTSRWRCALLS